MRSRSLRARDTTADYWPGFVDALAALVMVFMLLMTIFLLAKAVQDQVAGTLDVSNQRLRDQIAELSELLDLERRETRRLDDANAELMATLQTYEELQAARDSAAGTGTGLDGAASAALTREVEEQKRLSAAAQAQVELLNRQIEALRKQIGSLQAALDAAEESDRENKATIADLGRRLNAALARKVQELARYRSEFFQQLSTIIGDRDNIRVVGDRFVFQSEVLFDSGTADVNPAGRDQLRKLAGALRQLDEEIPASVNWILRVDGHTDERPISTARFPSNWHLSAARAISVVDFLRSEGVPARRLAATGFGEHQPLETGSSQDAYRRNRRIELKLTER